MKYMSRPMEVEAVQYVEEEKVDDLLNLLGGPRVAKAYVSMVPDKNNRGMRYALTLKTASDRYVLVVGDWLVENPHGGFEVWTDEAFKERFVI